MAEKFILCTFICIVCYCLGLLHAAPQHLNCLSVYLLTCMERHNVRVKCEMTPEQHACDFFYFVNSCIHYLKLT